MAFPTETVYGLGANALDELAVEQIFVRKGRPATSPLIVHCADTAMARRLTTGWTEAAERLATQFWPGPLTLVLPKTNEVPFRVTALLPTVGLRVPRHPVALALLHAAGVPIAAPSANPFMGVSPTRASHIPDGMADLVLEGGSSEVGIESTVLSLAGPPALLRPGMISHAELEAALGGRILIAPNTEGPHPSPGLHPQHYSPRTSFYLLAEGDSLPPGRGRHLEMPTDPEHFAQQIYAALHAADQEGWDWIAVWQPPTTPAWEAIRDRLQRAQHRP